MNITIKDIFIPPNRQRQKISEAKVAELAVSIQQHGQIHEVTVAPIDRVRFPDAPAHCQYQLVAGYRRLLALTLLKQPDARVNLKENLSPLELKEVELDENLQREELDYRDAVAAKAELVEIRHQLYGDSIRDVADHLNEAKSSTWEDVQLAKALKEHPEIATAKTKTQAQNRFRLLKRREALEEKAADLYASIGAYKGLSQKVLLGDCLEITKTWPSESVHLILTDPPYGTDLDKGETKKGSPHPAIYDDAHYNIMDLLSRVAQVAYRILVPDSHAYFFFDIKEHDKVSRILSASGFTVDLIPLVWAKPGPGQVNHPDSRWGSGYEVCFFCRKGSRSLLKQGQSNILLHDPVPSSQKIHPTEKPTSLLRQLIETSTARGEVVVDFFGGSGSTAEAAIQTGRDFLICELDAAYHAGILERLSKLQAASKYDPLGGEEDD